MNSIGWISGAALAALLFSASAHADPTPCEMTAQATLSACQSSASAHGWSALAVCDNDFAAGPKRDQCVSDALGSSQEAKQECGDQNDARLQTCGKVGGAAWAPRIKPANFVAEITNPYMPMIPGTTFVYDHSTDEGLEVDTVAVTHDTRVILGVATTVVHDTVTLDGAVTEDTFDFLAQDTNGNVWYFGEDSRGFEDGLLVGIEGSWLAGRDGAEPGILMKANPKVGDFYRQEFLPGEAEDAALVKSLDKPVTVPYGSFPRCLKTDESTDLEPGEIEKKFYAVGVGNVLTVETDGSREELVSVQTE